MCNVVVIDYFFLIKAAAWGGRPCSTAYSKTVATLSQRCRNAVAMFSMFWWKSPNQTKRLARAQKRPVLLTPICVFYIPRPAIFLTQANYYRPAHKVPSAPSLRQKTPPITGILPSFENAENSQVCCPGGPSRHHVPSEKTNTLCPAAPTAPSGPSVPLFLCDYDSDLAHLFRVFNQK